MEKGAKIYIAGHSGMLGAAIRRLLGGAGYKNIVYRTSSELDLRDQAAVNNFFRLERPEYVFDAAAKVGGIRANDTYRADFIYDNLQIQNNLFHSAWETGVKKLLFVACSCAYPRDSLQPMKEEYLLTGLPEPTNEPFSIAKIAGIKMCESYNRQYETNFISVIPAGMFGPGDNFDPADSHIISALIRKFHEAKLRRDTSVALWGSGKPRREFIYVDDAARACAFLMDNYASNEVINIGSGRDFSVREIAELIREVVGFEGDIAFDRSKPDGMPRKLLDSHRIKSLGCELSGDIRTQIRATYEWFTKEAIIHYTYDTGS